MPIQCNRTTGLLWPSSGDPRRREWARIGEAVVARNRTAKWLPYRLHLPGHAISIPAHDTGPMAASRASKAQLLEKMRVAAI